MPVRTAEATWTGNLREGRGTMRMKTGAFNGAYSYASRFEEAEGTSPEELIAAAHAGCYSMALSAGLTKAGYTPERIDTTAKVHLEGGKITTINLDTRAQVPNIDEPTFQKVADEASRACPVSVALAGTDIKLSAQLEH